MSEAPRPFVQVVIGDADSVIHDPEGLYDADRYDRFPTFAEARDAVLCCIEDVLDEGDYDGERQRAELESMHGLLESAQTFEDLEARPDYRRLLERLASTRAFAA